GKVISVRSTFACALVPLAALALLALSGCSETLPLAQLPDVTKLPQKVLSKDEQQGKVNERIEKTQTHQSDAAEQIEMGNEGMAASCPLNHRLLQPLPNQLSLYG